jgi:hypothetical protein
MQIITSGRTVFKPYNRSHRRPSLKTGQALKSLVDNDQVEALDDKRNTTLSMR